MRNLPEQIQVGHRAPIGAVLCSASHQRSATTYRAMT